MSFFRSGFVCPTPSYQTLARQQINTVTSFLDSDLVYGSEPSLARCLRNLSSPLGLLAVNQEVWDHGLAYLPFDNKKPSPCEFINTTAHVPCFQVGESRVGTEGPKDKRVESRGRPEKPHEAARQLPGSSHHLLEKCTPSHHCLWHWFGTGRRVQMNTESENMCSV